MEFGARLSRPSPASLPVTERSRLTARVILYGGLAVFVLAFLVFESHFYSHSEPCRHRLVALRNRAHSPSTTRILSLRGCRLSALPDGLTELTHLQRLDLSDNSFTDDAALDGLAVMAELDILFLTNNALARVPDVVAKLPRLRMLSLRDNRIQGPVALTWPKTLEWLILTGNSITRLMAAPVAVRKLMLSNNALTSFPDNLRQLTALELLRVSNNRIPRAALAEPTRVLPALRWYSCADNPGPQDSEAPTQNLLLTDASALRTHSVLGEGSSGVVYSATLNGRTRVALKEFRSPLSSDGRVMNEINMAAIVGNTNSHLLQRIVGWSPAADGKPLRIAYELVPEDAQFASLARPPSFTSCTLDVHALSILHSRRIAHGDLYGHNIRYNKYTGAAQLLDLGAAWRFDEVDRSAVEAVELRAYAQLVKEVMSRTALDARGAKLHDAVSAFLSSPPTSLNATLTRVASWEVLAQELM